MVTVIENARVVAPDEVLPCGYVVLEGDRITDVGSTPPRGRVGKRIDAEGHLLMPGLIDLHGDDIEGFQFPRPEAEISPVRALADCDVATLAAGITTKLHAIAFEEAPAADRSITRAHELVDGIARTDGLVADHRVHARCELTDRESVAAVREMVGEDVVDLVSLVMHVPGDGQFSDVEQFARRYGDGETDGQAAKLGVRRQSTASPVARGRIDRIVERAKSVGVPIASHDDECPDAVEHLADRGVAISEFPVTLEAAHRATELGLWTAMGAPNIIRGGSLWNNLDATTAIERGVVDILCSDYHPRSLLEAVFVETGEPLWKRAARATHYPSVALGYDDRGRIETGARADLIIVDPRPRPMVKRVILGGDDVYRVR